MLVERFNGRVWSLQNAPDPFGADSSLFNSVSCVSATFCAAVGLTTFGSDTSILIERWSGARWRLARAPAVAGTDVDLNGVSCTSTTACTAAGFADNAPLIVRWDGHRWTVQKTTSVPPSASSVDFSGVSCKSATVCTAVGATDQQPGADIPPATVAERWNGLRWSLQRTVTRSDGSWLNAFSCPASGGCVAVGGSRSGAAVVQRHS
jgi:hypothetical protein